MWNDGDGKEGRELQLDMRDRKEEEEGETEMDEIKIGEEDGRGEW